MKQAIILAIGLCSLLSCNNSQKNVAEQKASLPVKRPLGVDVNTLTNLSNDTTEIHIESGLPSGDVSVFHFKVLGKSRTNDQEMVRGLFVEYKSSENLKKTLENLDSPTIANYHAFAFQISKDEWHAIKRKAEEIEANIDSARINSFCEFCPYYLVAYNDKLLESKIVRDNMVKNLFDWLIEKYQKKLHSSRRDQSSR